jgi:hypothetical protein
MVNLMLSPLPPDRWNSETAAHLALRAGFGQTPDESKKWSQQGLEATLNHLLQTPPDNIAPPAWAYPTRDEDLLQRIRNPATTDPSSELVDALSGELRRCGYELKPFMKVVLASQEFYAESYNRLKQGYRRGISDGGNRLKGTGRRPGQYASCKCTGSSEFSSKRGYTNA